jgi:hypothetical protein
MMERFRLKENRVICIGNAQIVVVKIRTNCIQPDAHVVILEAITGIKVVHKKFEIGMSIWAPIKNWISVGVNPLINN